MRRVLLINPRSEFLDEQLWSPPLGPLTVATILRRWGAEVRFADLAAGDGLDDDLLDWAEIFGVYGTTPHWEDLKEIRASLPRDKRAVCGGPHSRIRPETLTDIGYEPGVYPPSEIVKLMLGVETVDGDKLFYPPARDLIHGAYKAPLPILASISCPFACSFCNKSPVTYFRYPPEEIGAEIRQTVEETGRRDFIWWDDLFGVDRNWLGAMRDEVADLGLDWRCSMKAPLVTEDRITVMKEFGLREIAVGVESGHPDILRTIKKRVTPEQNSKAREVAARLGIKFKSYIILGLPGENWETLQATYDWLRENEPDGVGLYLFIPYPGTDIWDNRHLYDIGFDWETPWGRLYYAGHPMEMESLVWTSALSREDLTAYFRWVLRDLGLVPDPMEACLE